MPGTFPTISSGSAFRYPITRSRTDRVVINIFCDFTEQRWVKGHDLTEFALQYKSISKADKEILRLFYAAQTGELLSNWTLVFDGITCDNCQFVGPFEQKNISANLWSVTLKVRCLPQATVTAATLYAVTSHVPGTPTESVSAFASNAGIVSLFNEANWFQDGSAWTQRTDTLSIAPSSINSVNIIFGTWSLSGGLGNQPFTSPDIFLIYDCWMQLTFADGSTAIQRPTSFSVDLGSSGTLVNPQYAIDGDTSTFATITTTAYSVLNYGPAMSVSQFE